MRLDSVPFNLDVTLCCGQVFKWDRIGDWWYGTVGDRVFKIRQHGAELDFVNIDEKFVKHYFGLKDDLLKIREKTGRDEYAKRALQKFWGLRIIRQEPWECLISYICATYKSIAAIKHMLFNLSKSFGEKVTFDGYEFYTFPTPKKLACATESDLKKCSLGYRAKYVLETSKKIYESDLELETLRKCSYEKAKKELTNFPGVGLKVADCVLLFSLEKLEAFPVDVWIRRIIIKHYADHFPKTFIEKISKQESLSNTGYEKMNIFGRDYFGEYAGYAQEYMFHYERTLSQTHI